MSAPRGAPVAAPMTPSDSAEESGAVSPEAVPPRPVPPLRVYAARDPRPDNRPTAAIGVLRTIASAILASPQDQAGNADGLPADPPKKK